MKEKRRPGRGRQRGEIGHHSIRRFDFIAVAFGVRRAGISHGVEGDLPRRTDRLHHLRALRTEGLIESVERIGRNAGRGNRSRLFLEQLPQLFVGGGVRRVRKMKTLRIRQGLAFLENGFVEDRIRQGVRRRGGHEWKDRVVRSVRSRPRLNRVDGASTGGPPRERRGAGSNGWVFHSGSGANRTAAFSPRRRNFAGLLVAIRSVRSL